ncbi:MAG: hypothetical protein ABI333_21760 [bacterium]
MSDQEKKPDAGQKRPPGRKRGRRRGRKPEPGSDAGTARKQRSDGGTAREQTPGDGTVRKHKPGADTARGQRSDGDNTRKRKSGGDSAWLKLHSPSLVDTDLPADEPLTPTEVEQMRLHLAFLKEFRGSLRIKWNAKEDLLVNGASRPEHRGTCKYLLSKVDRATIVQAVEREPLRSDPDSRARFLAGSASITGNVGILLRYLEALTATVRSEQAARAFAATVEHIDFEGLSAARMSRLLDVVQQAFPAEEQPGVLFGLLQSRSFRQAFDACAQELKENVAQRFVPLRAVFDTINSSPGKRRRTQGPRQDLEDGLRLMFAAPDPLLGYAAPVRERLIGDALALEADWPTAHAGVLALLDTFPKDGRVFHRYAGDCATRLASRGRDAAARELLQKMAPAGPSAAAARALLEQLDRPRFARFALRHEPPDDQASPLQRAYWLTPHRAVLIRLGRPERAEALALEARLQKDACLPGLADVLDSGTDDAGRPYVAVAAVPGHTRLDVALEERRRPPSLAESLSLATEGARILRALALAGITLPDASPDRFLWSGADADADANADARPPPRLLLADLRGAREATVELAAQALAPITLQWCLAALAYPPFRGKEPRRELPAGLRRALEEATQSPPSPQALATLLAAHLGDSPLQSAT